MILHDYRPSGNGYKVRLLLNLLDRPYDYRHYDIVHGETRTPAFLQKNPAGKIPVLELDDGRFLCESNAILYYLAQGSNYWPEGRWDQAQALRWMNFEQYSHEPNIATPRFWLTHLGLNDERQAQLAGKQALGREALAVMDDHLARQEWFVAGRYTIADIALFAYTHVAEDGGFTLADYPNVCRWLDRVASHPNHIAIIAE
ncbi:glutathione S-transferase family protein [Vreelandella venusta]|uniref:Glutathione S-transferase n=1 Tax=Vreelandella venusta TaxID=44935 RepID=A0ABX2BDG8_9GAMM|nr:glutathione S-transferase family protein [Halomonas venusta]AZM95689.1 glutathione S-transferase family protein [Halomonas venusta]NPT32172.1 glutathione S-transferase [Halomonas venusta]WAM57102.1 glutathione S-transferase family protein [Halomonas venusta]